LHRLTVTDGLDDKRTEDISRIYDLIHWLVTPTTERVAGDLHAVSLSYSLFRAAFTSRAVAPRQLTKLPWM